MVEKSLAAQIVKQKLLLFKGYKNIESLDPNELIISPNHPIDIELIVCKSCKLFALLPRQCVNCNSLVCNTCVLVSGDNKNCPACKLTGGKPNSLDNPNILSQQVMTLLTRISFACPNECGIRNIEFLDLHSHLIFYCENGTSTTKHEVMGRMMVLRDLLAKQKKEHGERMIRLKEDLTKKF